MAAGGIFFSHNKTLPGAYINFVSKARALGNVSERGVVALAFKMNWGLENKVISISSQDFQKNAIRIFGYSYSHEKLKPIREIFKNAKEIKLFRLGTGEKAKVDVGNLKVKALYAGSRGNDIKVKVSKNLDDSKSIISLYIDEEMVEQFTVSQISELKNSDYVEFSGTGDISANAGVSLAGGTDAVASNESYSQFLQLVESESFNTLIFDGESAETKALFESFTKRLRDDEGVKIVTVLYNYPSADFEGIVSVKNDKNLVYWVGGALAGANLNESLTNKKYDGEYEFNSKFSNSELNTCIEKGEFVLYSDSGQVKVLKDINTYTSITPEKNSDFSNNQIIRILDSTANDIAKIFSDFYLGKVQNDTVGRDIFKAETINYFRQLQSLRAIDNFSDDDISILKGSEKGDVIVDVLIEPISCMDKIYMKCIIE